MASPRTTRSKTGYKDTTVYEERVTQRGEHYYHPYYVGKLLGRGGFAYCHEVKTIGDEHTYAIKIIDKETDPKKMKEALYRIKEEIRILKSLSHPGIVKYYKDFQDAKFAYIVLELCRGGSLSDVLRKRKTFTEPQVRFFVAQMVPILLYLKKMNLLHRDIKLANYFLNENFRLKLGDFGLATINKNKNKLCGTPNYIAPEVVNKQFYSFEIDAWSTGVLVFCMLYGAAPFETSKVQKTYELVKKADYKFEGPNKTAVQCSDEAKMFISQLLCLDVKSRLKVEDFMAHPFMSNFQIPLELQDTFPALPPSLQFTNLYGKPKIIRPIQNIIAIPQSTVILEKVPPKHVIPVKFIAKAKGSVYKDILKAKQITIDEDEPIVKIQEYVCKREEDMAEVPPVKTEACVFIKLNESTLKYPDPLKEDECEQNTCKGRKQFRSNNLVKLEGEEQTQKRQLHKNVKISPNADTAQSESQWRRSNLKLSLKDPISSNHSSAEKRQIKVIHWQYCARKCGIAYILSNHSVGILFDDFECMQLSPQSNIIHYFHKTDGKIIRRELKTDEIDGLRVEEAGVLAKVQNLLHYQQVLRKRLPNSSKQEDTNDTVPSLPGNSGMVYLKGFRRSESVIIFSLSSNNNHFFFQDGSSMFYCLPLMFISYEVQGLKQIHSIPLDVKTLEESFSQKVKIVCSYYCKLLKAKPGEGSERWLLKSAAQSRCSWLESRRTSR